MRRDSMLVVRVPGAMKQALERRAFRLSLSAGVHVTSSDLIRRIIENFLTYSTEAVVSAVASDADTYLRNHPHIERE